MTRYIKSGTVNTVQEINSELERIATSQVDFLARDGETPNAMTAPLDMNSQRMLNLPAPASPTDPVRSIDLPNFIAEGNDLLLITREESVVLTAGQTLITLTELTTTQTAYYVSGQSVDQGRLIANTDYVVTNTTQITLTESYPVGTRLTAVQNEGVEKLVSDIQTFNDIAEMKQATLGVGDTVLCNRYVNGGALVGGLLFNIVAGGTGVNDGAKFHDLNNGNQAELIPSAIVNNEAIGSTSTGPLNVIGGALRVVTQAIGVDNTISIINDSEHDPINISSATIGLTQIVANHIQPAGSAVVGVTVAAPDEEMIKLGLQIGGSISTTQSIFTFSKPHTFIIDWENALVIDPFMDVAQRYGVTDNTTHYTILHPQAYGTTRGLTKIDDTGPDATYIFFTKSNTDIYPYKNDVTLEVLYNGSSFEIHHANPLIDAALSTLGISVVESGGVFTITHPIARRDDANPTATAGRTQTGDYFGVLAHPSDAFPKTKTIVICPDLDTASGTHTFVNTESFRVTLREILWKFGKTAVDLGIVQVSPTLDFKNTGSGNNFWLLGNHWALK